MKNLTILLVIGSFFFSPLSFAGKIYKWTDSDGNVQYGERPPNRQAQQIKIQKGPSGTSATTPSSRQESTQKLLDAFEKERKDKGEAEAKMAADKALRDKNCSNARRRVASLNFGGRQYEVDEKGERSYLSDADIKSRTAEAQKVADKWCQ